MTRCLPVVALVSALLSVGLPASAEDGLKDCADIDPAQAQELAKEEWQQVIKARQAFAQACGLEPHEMMMIQRAKGRRHHLVQELRREAEALLVALETEEADQDFVQQKVNSYLSRRDQTEDAMRQIDERLIEALDARNRPKIMGALMVMSAVDNGIQSTCAVRSPVSGSASTTAIRPPLGGPGGLGPRRPLARRPVVQP